MMSRSLGESRNRKLVGCAAAVICAAAFALPASAAATPPSVVFTAPTPGVDAVLNANNVAVGFSAAANPPATLTSTTCVLDAGAAVACASPRSYSGLADGSHTVSVTATDSNNESATASRQFRIDTALPQVSITAPVEGQQIWGPAVDVSFSAQDVGTVGESTGLATLRCGVDAQIPAACPASLATRLTGLADGAHSYTVTAVDAAGNSTAVVRSFTVSESAQPPTVNLEISSTRATSHPDARVTVSNLASSQAIKTLRLKLPAGFWGSLAAAPKCDYSTAQSNGCAQASQIGSVDVDALLDASDVRLRGRLFLTTPAPANANSDPAGITVIVPAVVGGVDLGLITVNGRVIIRNARVPNAAAGVVGAVEGMDVLIDQIPQSHTDADSGRSVSFRLKSFAADLTSDLDGPAPPLLTNPSTCGALNFGASVASYAGKLASAVDGSPPLITGCDTAKFDPGFDMVATNATAGGLSGLTAEITLPSDSATFKSITVKFPPMMGPAYPSFGASADQCESSSAAISSSPFNPALCPPQAKIGTLSLDTPLLPGPPLVGNLYLINKSPLPWLGIDINPSVAASNPKGLVVRLVGQTFTQQLDPTCDTAVSGFCQAQIGVVFAGLPDAPTTKISINANGPDRVGVGGHVLSGKFFTITAGSDALCQPKDEFTAAMTNNSGATIRGDRVKTQAFSGCGSREISIADGAGSAIGKTVTTSQPAIAFSGVADDCFFDSEATAAPCGSPLTPAAPLSRGIHRVFVRAGGQSENRAFAVATPPGPLDATAPATSFAVSPPPTVSDDTPTFQLAATEPSAFQCAIGPGTNANAIGAFLPCDHASVNGTTYSYTVTDPLIAGKTYTLAVRAQDAAGNVDLTPATATFKVDPPLASDLDYSVTTTAARANPNLDLTIVNPSHEDLEDIALKLPNGFFGGLTGAALLCPAGAAATAACPAGSQIGQVDADAVVDESTIRLSGPIYLTDPLQPGDAAGLAIKVPAVLQSVDLGDIVVLARLNVRGQAEGLDTLAVQLPRDIDPAASGNTVDALTAFDLRRLTLKLRTNPAAGYPLLTNPSSCIPGAFSVNVSGYSGSSAAGSKAFTATGCDTLPFSPSLSTYVVKQGATTAPALGDMVEVHASVKSKTTDSALKNVSVSFPPPISVDRSKLGAVCKQSEYAAGACPAAAQVGTASAVSPLLFNPLSGPVYLLEPEAPRTIPRLLIELRGIVNVDVIGVNSYVNGSQIQSAFTQLPDVPFTDFQMSFGGLMSVAYDPCESGPDNLLVGSMFAHDGKSVPVKNALTIKRPCGSLSAKSVGIFRKGKRAKFKITQPAGKVKTIRYIVRLPRGATFIPRAAARKIVVEADGKRIKSTCFKVGRTTLTIGFCRKQVGRIVVTANPGSILTTKTIARPKLAITQVGADKKTRRRSLVVGR